MGIEGALSSEVPSCTLFSSDGVCEGLVCNQTERSLAGSFSRVTSLGWSGALLVPVAGELAVYLKCPSTEVGVRRVAWTSPHFSLPGGLQTGFRLRSVATRPVSRGSVEEAREQESTWSCWWNSSGGPPRI